MSMKGISTKIPEVLLFEPKVFGDERGFFFESFNHLQFEKAVGYPVTFVQDNHSCSKRGVLRGLHYQVGPHAQGKLVRVVNGSAFDVAVDIRKNSPTFLKWVGVELNSSNKKMLWIPEGFAHGFLALEEDTHFLYKTTDYYDKESERSILWSDESIGIMWPELGEFVISQKDLDAPLANNL